MHLLPLLFLLLTTPIVDHPGPRPDVPVVIGLHGRGDTPENFSHVADRLGPQFHWIFPRGPLQWKPGLEGTQWFDRQAPDGGHTALEDALKLLEKQVKLAGKKPVAIVGFSQGCMLALAYVTRHPQQVRGVLCVGGMLLETPHVPPGPHRTPILLVHGVNDPLVPIQKAREALKFLQEAHFPVKLLEHPGGHVIPPERASELRAWLTGVLQ